MWVPHSLAPSWKTDEPALIDLSTAFLLLLVKASCALVGAVTAHFTQFQGYPWV